MPSDSILPASIVGRDPLATALSIGADLGAVFCYDERLTAAARAAGLDVRAPR